MNLLLEQSTPKRYELEIRRLLASPGGVNAKNFDNNTPLNLAIYDEDIDMVKTLLSKGAYINSHEREVEPPIICASSRGNLEIARLLIAAGANVNAIQNWSGWSPLMMACSSNNVELAKVLITNGADINYASHYNDSALAVAALSPGRLEVLKFLLSTRRIHLESIHSRVLYEAIDRCNEEAVKALIASGIPVNYPEMEFPILAFACRSKNLNIIKMLLAAGANFEVKDYAWNELGGKRDFWEVVEGTEIGALLHSAGLAQDLISSLEDDGFSV
jgi:ankyrin repeat protein